MCIYLKQNVLGVLATGGRFLGEAGTSGSGVVCPFPSYKVVPFLVSFGLNSCQVAPTWFERRHNMPRATKPMPLREEEEETTAILLLLLLLTAASVDIGIIVTPLVSS